MNKKYLLSDYCSNPLEAIETYRNYFGMTLCEFFGWLDWINVNLID